MKLVDYLKISLMNLSSRKLRTAINVFSISIGVMLIVTLLSLGNGFEVFFMSKVKELNNLKNVTVLNTEYKNQDELSIALAQTNENGDVDTNNLFTPKTITEEVVTRLSEDNRVEELLSKYESEVSEVVFGDKKAKEVKVAYYTDNNYYLESEAESLEEQSQNSLLRMVDVSVEYIYEGRLLTEEDTNSVMIPENFVRNTLNIEDVSSIIGHEIEIKTIIPDYDETKTFQKTLKVVGVIDQRFYQPAFVVSKDVMQEIKNFENNTESSLETIGADKLELSVVDLDDVYELTNLAQNELGYSTESVSNIANTIENVLYGIKVALSLLGIIVVSIASLDVINTMIMSIHERTKLIGLMRATGASKRDIMNLFLVESATIGLLGGIFGCIFSYFSLKIIKVFLMYAMNYFEISDLTIVNEVTKVDALTALFTIIFAIALTVLAGLYPSIRASKLNPIDAIKHD